MSKTKYAVFAWVLAALLTASAAMLVLSHDPVVAGGGSGESGSGEGSGSGESPSGSGE